MYLKKLKMVGFKSFVNPTEIVFDDRITGIVGPNGSGKSNVVDAVRWVLGEQSVKSLRGEGNMSDVIFSGSKTRRESNFAEVELTFDNTDRYLSIDLDEVIIKRTIFKTGENEYSINNAKTRLKDILDLFTDTGASKESYNIISQGDIGNILSSKSEDRRIIFEDASGVLKYKKRKEEALRKLVKTNDNIVRINDIINENEERLEPLKNQSEKAKIYLNNKEELQNIEVALIINDINNYNNTYKTSKEKIEVLQNKITELLSKSSSNEVNIEIIKSQIDDENKKLYDKQQKLISISANVEKYLGEKNLINERNKYKVDDVKLRNNILSLKENILIIDNEINSLNENISIDNKNNERIEKEFNEVISKIANIEKDKNRLSNEITSKIREIEVLKNKKINIENEIENNSIVPLPVKSVLNNPKLIGIEGIIGNLFEVDEKYTRLIEAALGSCSSYVVTRNENDAKDAVMYLKNNNLGRATFYPISVIKSRNIETEYINKIKSNEAYIGIGIDLIKFDDKYKNVLGNLLGNIIAVKDIDSANKISKTINNRYKIVTLDGDIVNAGGSITGGSYKNKRNILTIKYELEDTIKSITKSENDLNILEDNINIIDEEYAKYSKSKNELYLTINSNSELLKQRNNRIKDLELQKLTLEEELKYNEGSINGNVSKEEEEVLNKYYDEKKKQEKISLEIEDIVKNINRIKEKLSIEETNLKIDNSEYNTIQDELKKEEISVSKLDIKLDNLLNTLNEEYSITYEKAKELYILDRNPDEARTIVNKLKREIRELGEVNVSSIEEYEKVNERYTFLTSQREDLEHAKEMLLDIIKQMDEVMKEKFVATFKLVQVEFKEIFKKLFGGGDAELKLTDPSNVLETGIDIIALPPGKKLQHISLLSGGEKTLTAIALLFAILKTRPVPFCILDEVEAALDEVNVDNFGKYLSSFKDKTEFIVITHKKKTMEYADTLYGITMQESGVSKLVSVKLEDIKK